MSDSGLFSIAIIGAGTMGRGIAQVAATSGHEVILFDQDPSMQEKAIEEIHKIFSMLVQKGKLEQSAADQIVKRIRSAQSISEFSSCGLVIEAIVEDQNVKQKLFSDLEQIVPPDAFLASNTSSLSITAIASTCRNQGRVFGMHFFNPAPLMPLVEIVPGLASKPEGTLELVKLIKSWGKIPVTVKDTPGFIVNRLARPFYGEAIRIYEEGWKGIPEGEEGFATIDWALREKGGFKMGPFELMDLIGNDINFTVTEMIWKLFFYDSKYKPSLTQKRLIEAKRFGKKSGQGYYSYRDGTNRANPMTDSALAESISERVIVMLINEAIEALYLRVASRDDLDLAMIRGVNYPKGLLKWCDEIGVAKVLSVLEDLHKTYGEERYRPNVLLRTMAAEGKKFYS